MKSVSSLVPILSGFLKSKNGSEISELATTVTALFSCKTLVVQFYEILPNTPSIPTCLLNVSVFLVVFQCSSVVS